MRSLEVCVSPELIHLFSLENKVVVIIDILRATSSMVAGLANGIKCIAPVATIDATLPWQQKGYLRAGERNGKKISDFDLGNSPREFIEIGKRCHPCVVMTTTNGTHTLKKSLQADHVVIGSFLNISRLTSYLNNCGKGVLLHCAGWKGNVNIEDTLFAGAVVWNLSQTNSFIKNDAAAIAESVYMAHRENLLAVVQKSEHARRLNSEQAAADVRYCMQEDLFDNIPHYSEKHLVNMP